MSESGARETPPPAGGGLYDEAGRPLRSGRSEQPTEDLVRFAKEHPLATAAGAFVLGYILGKMF